MVVKYDSVITLSVEGGNRKRKVKVYDKPMRWTVQRAYDLAETLNTINHRPVVNSISIKFKRVN